MAQRVQGRASGPSELIEPLSLVELLADCRATSNGPDSIQDDAPLDSPDMRLATAMTAALPVTAGGDPVPQGTNGTASTVDVKPPPGIENMPPLSATAISSFASAAKGVTTKEDAGPGQTGNPAGLLVLNGSKA